ncbi:hypothetical protein KY284_035936 [Solanum tuberosum]|nr:hypothetical protein KY284_035936 [Solanum tuberosum]
MTKGAMLQHQYQRPSCMSIGTRSSLIKDHKGMVGIDATSTDAYIPGQSGRDMVLIFWTGLEMSKRCFRSLQFSSFVCALVSSQVYCKEEQGFQIVEGCEGCRCGDTVQVNTGRCSVGASWTKHGRRKCEGHA